jgi:chromosome segregation ATPase
MPAGPATPPSEEGIRKQATQLAEHLRSRQKELDHREAELNARAAQLERDTRAAQIWYSERVAEFAERGEAGNPESEQREESLRKLAAALDARKARLDEAEVQLGIQQAETRRLYEQLSTERREFEAEMEQQRERLATEQRRSVAELDQRRRALHRRSEQVDQSRAALEQFRGELGHMHRETLEIRLATEELWAQLSATAPPATLVQSLGRIRNQIADHYRLANAELRQQKEELEKVRQELSEQHDRLVRQKRQFDAWAAGSRHDADEQASRLMARAREVERREIELREESRNWLAERMELQQKIRRLRAELARCEPALID